jgi:hypothetical protein
MSEGVGTYNEWHWSETHKGWIGTIGGSYLEFRMMIQNRTKTFCEKPKCTPLQLWDMSSNRRREALASVGLYAADWREDE